jgi:hypothetical protein
MCVHSSAPPPPASTPALSRGLGSSLRFAPAFARGETPFRMTAFWPLVPKLQLGNALVLEALLPSAGICAGHSCVIRTDEAELRRQWHYQAGAW